MGSGHTLKQNLRNDDSIMTFPQISLKTGVLKSTTSSVTLTMALLAVTKLEDRGSYDVSDPKLKSNVLQFL